MGQTTTLERFIGPDVTLTSQRRKDNLIKKEVDPSMGDPQGPIDDYGSLNDSS